MQVSTIFPLLLDETINRYAYLINTPTHKILIDAGARHLSDKLFALIQREIMIEELDYIILQTNDYLNISGFENITNKGFKGTLIVHEAIIPFIDKFTSAKFLTIDQLNYRLTVEKITLINNASFS